MKRDILDRITFAIGVLAIVCFSISILCDIWLFFNR